MRSILAGSVVLALVVVPAILSAQSKRPDFSGAWQEDIDASKVLTEKKGEVWTVAGAGAGGATAGTQPAGNITVMRPTTTITQTQAEIVFERRWEGEVLSRDVFKLDGSLSVNARRFQSSRSTTVWKGTSLVTSGTRIISVGNDAVDASGRPLDDIVEQFVTTRTLMPDGTMQTESRATRNGQEMHVLWAVLVRVKS